jgi:hypothetical protein
MKKSAKLSVIEATKATITRANIAVAPAVNLPENAIIRDAHRKYFRRQPDFPTDATVKLLTGVNPWRAYGLGWNFYEKVLRHHPESTVGELLTWGRKANIGEMETMEHLRWLFTWGGSYVEIGGRLFSPPPEKELDKPTKRQKRGLAIAG